MHRLLDLFCGAGGSAKGYQRAGLEVYGVDVKPQPAYCGDAFIQSEALEYLKALEASDEIDKFDAIHASPPCQAYSIACHYNRNNYSDLVEETRRLLKLSGKPYIIENVYHAPLLYPIMLCGSSFGLPIRRHRLFESNLMLLGPECDHAWQERNKRFRVYRHHKWIQSGVVPVYGLGGGKASESWSDAMGIDWMVTRAELAQAIPPAFTEFLGGQLIQALG